MSTSQTIFAGVAVYIVLMVLLAVYAARRTHSTAEFIVAGRRLPLWLCTVSIIATWFGGGMLIGAAGAAYADGFLGVIADPFGATVCLVLMGLFVVRIVRRLRIMTFVEFVEQRFGRTASVFTSLASVTSILFWVVGMLVAFGVVFQTLTGTPLVASILLGGAVVTAYTAMGGMLAVALTDFVQMVVIAIGLVMLLVVALIAEGGWNAVAVQLPADTFRMTPLENSGEAWLNYLRAWVIFGLADIASQSLFGRALSARDEKTAQNAFYLGAIGYLAIAMVPVMIAIIGSVTLPPLANHESVIPAMALEYLHPVAIAIFVGAILAAIMSSCDSAILATASILSRNLLPVVVHEPSDTLQLRVVRWGVVIVGVAGTLVAANIQEVFETVLDANMLILAAIIVPFLMGIWWKKANRTGALAAMSAGTVSWLLTSIVYPQLPGDLIGLGVSFVTMLVVTPLTQTFDPPRQLHDIDGNPVELTDRLGTLR